MLIHDWPEWEPNAEFTEAHRRERQVEIKYEKLPISALFVMMNAWRDIHVYMYSLGSRLLYIAERSDSQQRSHLKYPGGAAAGGTANLKPGKSVCISAEKAPIVWYILL